MDASTLIGLFVTVITIIFVIAPALVVFIFEPHHTTYKDCVLMGLGFMLAIVLIVVMVLAAVIAIEFLTGNFDIVSELWERFKQIDLQVN
jgi:uncharacterized membrane protein